jgi:hypothetical protein
MPWKETCSMDERVRLIALWNEGQMTVSELVRVFGISRNGSQVVGALRAGWGCGVGWWCAGSASPPQCHARRDGGGAPRAWCVDLKGHFGLCDKSRCYPLPLTTKYLVICSSAKPSSGKTPSASRCTSTERSVGTGFHFAFVRTMVRRSLRQHWAA